MNAVPRLLLLFGLVAAGGVSASTVHFVVYQGAVTPVSAEFLVGEIARAEREGAEAVVLEIDTPGGLDTAMREIVKAELGARVPVVVHVAPPGSRAASAGVFVAYAAHVAAMAPGTNIGSASPVQMTGGSMDSTMARKVTNDAVAYLRSIARERGRDEQWAERFVAHAENLPAEEALAAGVIDLVVDGRTELLDALDGRTVAFGARTDTLRTRDATIVERSMGLRHRLLNSIANPTIAYLLLLLGIYGIFFELSNPGSVLPGVAGALAILLALFALQALPVRGAGLALIALGLVLFVLEVFVTSYGLLGFSGVVALGFGSVMLFEEGVRVPWPVLVGAVGLTGGFVALCVTLAVRGQRRPVVTGLGAMIGERARVSVDIATGGPGKIVLHGEVWDAVCDRPVAAGSTVEVLAREGRVVRVRPIDPSSLASPDRPSRS